MKFKKEKKKRNDTLSVLLADPPGRWPLCLQMVLEYFKIKLNYMKWKKNWKLFFIERRKTEYRDIKNLLAPHSVLDVISFIVSF